MNDLDRFDDWKLDAVCRGSDPRLFFPERGESTTDAKAMCARCPVADQCHEDAMVHGTKHGIWGGLSERERRVARRVAATATDRPCRRCHATFTPDRPRVVYCDQCRVALRSESHRRSRGNYGPPTVRTPARAKAPGEAVVPIDLDAQRRARAAVGTEPNGGIPRLRGKNLRRS